MGDLDTLRDQAQELYEKAIRDPNLEAAVMTAALNLIASSAMQAPDRKAELESKLDKFNRLAKTAFVDFAKVEISRRKRRKYDA